MIKTLLCDIGNVLLNFDIMKGFDQMGHVLGVKPELLYKKTMSHELDIRYETGEIETELLCNYFKSFATRDHTTEELIAAYCNVFTPNEAILPVIKALKANGIRLVLLSNISDAHHQYVFRKYPFFQLFDERVFSYEVKAMKPSEKIYQAAIAVAECDPSQCFYVDDIAEYVDVARKLNIDAEQFKGVEDFKEALEKREMLKRV